MSVARSCQPLFVACFFPRHPRTTGCCAREMLSASWQHCPLLNCCALFSDPSAVRCCLHSRRDERSFEFDREQVVSVVHVDRRSDEGLDEIEDCWQLRDAGYHTIWASEVQQWWSRYAVPRPRVARVVPIKPRNNPLVMGFGYHNESHVFSQRSSSAVFRYTAIVFACTTPRYGIPGPSLYARSNSRAQKLDIGAQR